MSVKKNVFYTTALRLPIVTLNIIAGVFMTRLLGPEGKGVYAIFQAGIDLFILLLGFSIQSGIIYFLSSGKIQKNRLLGISYFVVIVSTILNIAILFIANKTNTLHYFFAEGYTSTFYYIWFSLVFGTQMYASVIQALFQGEIKFKIVNGMGLLNGVLYLSVFSFLFFTWESDEYLDIQQFLLIILGITGIMGACWTLLLITKIKVKPDFSFDFKKELKPFITFNLIAYGANLLQFFNYRLDLWVIEYFKNISQVGIYSLAVNIANFFLIISSPIAAVLYSYFSKGESDENKHALAFFSRVNFTLVFLLSVVAFFAADIIGIVYGNDFYSAITPFRILLPGFIFLCASKTFSSYMTANNKPKYNLSASILALFVTVVLDFILIPIYGIEGAAIATSITYFVLFIVVYFYCFRKFDLPKANYFISNWGDMKELANIVKGKSK